MSTSLAIRARLSDNPVQGEVDVFVWGVRDGQIYAPQKLELQTEPTPVGEDRSIGSIVTVSKDTAQQLLDDLFTAGFRPSKGANIGGEMKAKDAHIAFAERTVESLIRCLPQSQRTT